jgi:hypothetical protein
MTGDFVKRYPDGSRRRRAADHYRWLASVGGPLLLPELRAIGRLDLRFERIDGRHARPADLTLLAAHLGAVHATTHCRELRDARLGQPFHTAGGYVIPSFTCRRMDAVEREIRSGHVPDSALTVDQAQRLLAQADGPAAFYKDANLRNFLITPAGNPVTVDFDDLTLAPFGYDLAKLAVSLAMTCGPLPAGLIADALTDYNTAVAAQTPEVPGVTWDELMNWAEIHHILTSQYAAHGRYPCRWDEVRPSTLLTGLPRWP